MPVETQWYLPKRVIYQRFYGVVTVDDFARSIRQIGEFVAEGDAPVHAIANVLDVERWPLLNLSKVNKHGTYPGMGWTVIVVTNPTLRLFSTILGQFSSQYIHSVPHITEAISFLSRRDSTPHFP